MGPIEILLGVAFPLFVGGGIALALSDASWAEFWFARALFIIAGVDVAGLAIYWLCTVDWSLLRRLVYGAVIGAIVLSSMVGALVWINKREARRTPEPPAASHSVNYAYALAFIGLVPSLDLKNQLNRFEVRVVLKNKADGPLRYRMEKMVTKIANYEIKTDIPTPYILSKDEQVTFFPSGGLTGKQYLALSPRPTGSMDLVIAYGHPDSGMSRRLFLTLHLDFFKQNPGKKNEGTNVNWIVRDQRDEAIDKL